MRFKTTEAAWSGFCSEMLARTDVETAGIALCRVHDNRDEEPLLVVEELKLVPDSGYLIREPDRIRIDPIMLTRLTQRARDEGLSIYTVHTHPLSDDPWFSWADDTGDARLMPALRTQVPGVPHGSIVIAQTGRALARAFDAAGKPHTINLDIVGKRITRYRERAAAEPDERFARQVLALGEHGNAILSSLTAAVVGLGGVGSVVSAQAGHHGIGRLLLMDGDLVERTNLPRLLGAKSEDVGRTSKVRVAQRYLEDTRAATKVTPHETFLNGENELRFLRGADVIFSCVDRHTPRARLNELAYKANIPLIDMGVAFRVGNDGRLESCAGRVVVVGPGRPCLLCWDHISPDRLREEAMTDEERKAVAKQGYLHGAVDEAQPSVMAFNTMVAGAAMIEMLRLATGFAGTADPPNRLGFQFTTGEVVRNGIRRRAGCPVCGISARTVDDKKCLP